MPRLYGLVLGSSMGFVPIRMGASVAGVCSILSRTGRDLNAYRYRCSGRCQLTSSHIQAKKVQLFIERLKRLVSSLKTGNYICSI